MRHKRKGRRLGRSSSHRHAMLKNLASSLILTERDPADFELIASGDGREVNPPAVPGRVVTTLEKAKEVRPLVEKCITIARRSLQHKKAAEEFTTDAARNSTEWKEWRTSETWQKWNAAIAPSVAARRRALQLLGNKNKEAVAILFNKLAPRFADRDGGYTRVVRLAQTRLGDAGTQAILEFVGVRDRQVEKSEKPAFAADVEDVENQLIDESVDSANTSTVDTLEDADATTGQETETSVSTSSDAEGDEVESSETTEKE